MRISRLYLKIYFYFLAVFLISFIILVPLIFFFSVDRPYRNVSQKRMAVMVSIMEGLMFKKDLQSALDEIGETTKSRITLYDSSGRERISSGGKGEDLDNTIINSVAKKGFYSSLSRTEDRIFYVLPLEDRANEKKPDYSYISFSTSFSAQKDRNNNRFFLWLLIMCIILSILIYPLAIHIASPLKRITHKAIKFSKGDFSELEKVRGKSVLGDEISQLDRAFTHMAGELISMIEAKKMLLSDISHELGSPLSRMKVATEIIEDKVSISKVPSLELVRGLSDDIDEMSRLVKELLEFSKMDRTDYTVKLEPCNLCKLVENTVNGFKEVCRKSNMEIEIEKAGEFEDISLDEHKISRVLQNLLTNAIKYSSSDETIKVLLKEEEKSFFVSVIDRGPGIKKENSEKIFEPFFREDPSRTRETGGTGLGLAIARKIINLHGGRIWVENPGEKGAVITFMLKGSADK